MNQYTPLLFKRVSLISTNFLRYEGNLVAIQDNSVILSNVKCFGTEDREVTKQIPAAQEIYEYIIFKEAQIKTLNLSNDQFMYGVNPNPGMNPMMFNPYHNYMGPQSFFPMPYLYYGNWYNQMQSPPGMNNNFMNENESKQHQQQGGNRGFGDYPFDAMNNVRNLNGPPMEQFDTTQIKNFEGEGVSPNTQSKLNLFKDPQNKLNETKSNETQTKLSEVTLSKQIEPQPKLSDNQFKPNDQNTQPKLNEVSQFKPNEQKNVTQDKKIEKTIEQPKSTTDNKKVTQTNVVNQDKTNFKTNNTTTNTLKENNYKDNTVNTAEDKTNDGKYDRNDQNSNYKKNNYQPNQYNRSNGYRYGNENRYNGENRYNSDNRYNNDNRYNGENRYNNDNRYNSDNRYNGGNRYNGSNYNKNYTGGNKGGPRRNYNNQFTNASEIDIFESTKKFEKEKELAQIEAEFQKQKEEGNLLADLNPENAYDPSSSIYDNLSCETLDKKNSKRTNKHERAKQLKEQERIDAETFGLSYNNSYNSNNYYANRNYNNTKSYNRNPNYEKGPNPSHRQHNPRQQYTPKGHQKKVFRVKNSNTDE